MLMHHKMVLVVRWRYDYFEKKLSNMTLCKILFDSLLDWMVHKLYDTSIYKRTYTKEFLIYKIATFQRRLCAKRMIKIMMIKHDCELCQPCLLTTKSFKTCPKGKICSLYTYYLMCNNVIHSYGWLLCEHYKEWK